MNPEWILYWMEKKNDIKTVLGQLTKENMASTNENIREFDDCIVTTSETIFVKYSGIEGHNIIKYFQMIKKCK